ncbi:aspartate aminotransferase family protein [bacterium D16-51]|nr:aspartate aminotransferase family protein [bacterium D16-59]RKI61061.1 aspartate aminotransferase family protein [bacterium D16-51]
MEKDLDQYLIHTYNRSVIFEKGEDVYLYDDQGKKYLDMGAGIAVSALGYSNEEFKQGVKDQVDKLIHISNLYYTKPVLCAAQYLAEASGMDRVFFTNSGTEAIEGALKLARKYAYLKNEDSKGEIIAMEHSFHGRSMGAVSVTGTKHYREAFEPLIGGVSFAVYNDLESVKKLVTKDTCAILLETVQGEGGIYPASEEFLKGIRRLCDENDIAMILDEIQCGMGRTGKMFAYEHYGILPDIMTSAKALGNGVPVGAFAAVEKFAEAMCPGDHGTTYGGNPLAAAAVCKVFEIFKKKGIPCHVQEISSYFFEKLKALAEKYPSVITEVRGKGLLIGLEVSCPNGEIVKKAMEKGLVLLTAGSNVVRIAPPLVIEKEQIDACLQILDGIFSEL